MLLKACLNGDHAPGDHPALPLTARELAADAERAVRAGAGALHFHPRDEDGLESLEPEHVHAAVGAVRDAVPGVPVGVSTGSWIERDPRRRAALIESWAGPDAPDFASVNVYEDGADLAWAALMAAGVEPEAGLRDPRDADRIPAGGEPLRVLLEPVDHDPEIAWQKAEAIAARVTAPAPLLAHGLGQATWTVIGRAAARGWDVRIGLEDTLELEDGRIAGGNADLVRRAATDVGL